MRVTVDTNILVSATGWDGNERELFQRAVHGDFTIIIGEGILIEYLEVIHRGKFSFLDKEKIKRFILLILEFCEVVDVKSRLKVIKEDPSDNMVLECAKDGNADFIVSGDAHLLKLRTWNGIRILTCRKFLEQL